MPSIIDTIFPKPKKDSEHAEEVEQVKKGLVRRFARGNVRLQQGKYITEEVAKERKNKVLRHKF